jgi:hypothetical protein
MTNLGFSPSPTKLRSICSIISDPLSGSRPEPVILIQCKPQSFQVIGGIDVLQNTTEIIIRQSCSQLFLYLSEIESVPIGVPAIDE